MFIAALFTITKRWNEDKDAVTDEWIKKIHTYIYYVHQLWPLWFISWLFVTPQTAARQASLVLHHLLELAQTHVHWVGDAIQPSHPLSSLLLLSSIFPSIRIFPMSQLFQPGSQSTAVSASASVFPMNTQDWYPLGWTGWISLKSKGLSRVFSNTTVQKHQFFGAQLSL